MTGSAPAAAMRLQKLLAHAGVSSRRQAEAWIAQGRVTVNGQVVQQLGTKVDPSRDIVAVDGTPIALTERLEYYLLNKPAGYLSTVHDPQQRRTVMALLKGVKTRVYPVGRLDQDSEGMLLLTNDGELAHRLTHPRFEVEKEYAVELARPINSAALDTIRRGVESQGEHLRPRRIQLTGEPPDGRHVVVVLAEGKKREVRRMFETVGCRVRKLVRTRFGTLRLESLPSGRYRPLEKGEIEQLRAITSD